MCTGKNNMNDKKNLPSFAPVTVLLIPEKLLNFQTFSLFLLNICISGLHFELQICWRGVEKKPIFLLFYGF